MSEELRAKILANCEPDENGCWIWQRGKDKDGYGRLWAGGKNRLAHRCSYEAFVGEIPDQLCVCHSCDVPSCVRPTHLWLGSQEDNVHDRDQKGRHNCGRGERHGSQTKPERVSRGEKHSAKLRECAARGDRHGSKTRPECIPRGDRHGRHTQPERTARGERNGNAKLTAERVSEIRARYAAGGVSQRTLAREFGISFQGVSKIIHNKIWRSAPAL